MGLFSNPFRPPPAPPAFGGGKTVPEDTASWLSRITFYWLGPFLAVGFTRPLEVEDFWDLPERRSTAHISNNMERNFYDRCAPEKRPRHLRAQSGSEGSEPTSRTQSISSASNHDEKKVDEKEREGKDGKSKKPMFDESLFRAIHRTFFVRIWTAGLLKVTSDTLKTTTPLLNKVILTWLGQSFIYAKASEEQRAAFGLTKPHGIGYGIGLAFALFVMQETASLLTNQYMQTTLTTGLSVRTGVIGMVVRKSMRISGRARVNHSVGQITTIISADATRLDQFSSFGHNLWASPIQLAIGIGLLIGNLGYSALVGLGVLLLGFPIQFVLVKLMFAQRKKGIFLTDKRVRLTTEVLQGIRLLKAYAWEAFYLQQVGEFRSKEIKAIRKVAMARSILIALMTFIPVLASILSFVTYALSGHDLNIAIIFTSLQLFNIIRMPLIFFPLVLSSLAETLVSLKRISTFLTAEDLPEPYAIDNGSPLAVDVDGDFVWETVLNPAVNKFAKKPGSGPGGKPGDKPSPSKDKGSQPTKKSRWRKGKKGDAPAVLPLNSGDVGEKQGDKKGAEEKKKEEKPFELHNLRMTIPKGAFIGVVGRVGTGKSSVLQALIGEMRKTRGHVRFGGKVSYAPQVPWIRNATLRQNILFGRDDDEERFREVVRACSLEHDLVMLPQGESTEIGEKGINLSGGQKARVSLARAAYSDSEIVLLDDPLSAVDAYVGKSILDNCLLSGPLADRTRILVTHSLHVLDKTDYIYVMDHGSIVEEGTYDDLMDKPSILAKLMEEYGSAESDDEGPTDKTTKKDAKASSDSVDKKKKDTQKLMQDEERNTGAVTWDTYRRYFSFAGGVVWIPFILLMLGLSQGAQVGNNLFLGFWTAESIRGFKQGDYMALYAGLGVAQAIFTFILSYGFAIASLYASLNLFRTALNSILRSPIAFFDTTPMGRILSRLSKDQDTLDNQLSLTSSQFLITFSSVLGTIALVFYTFPFLGILFVPLTIGYYLVSVYYRRTSVETKRVDSVLRSILYGAVTENLTGLATIRAYRDQHRAISEADRGLDLENKAYFMTISVQRWIGIRLDIFSNVLLLGIGLFAAGFRTSVNPAKIGVVLSYTLAMTQSFSDMVTLFAQNEQNMNAVERILHYTELPPEGDAHTPQDPPPEWPDKGQIAFTDVEMAYRPGLPLVLKGVNFQIRPGEKVGIIGRTGAGKSSLLQALLRIVELHAGRIDIDGVDISKIGLDALRKSLALVPQDSTLFLGTLRDNLDPQGLRTDAELISVLQRAWLLPKEGSLPDPAAEGKFSLTATVGDEGSNYSAGEKQLLALSRALIKNSKIIILDEATSSVDVETDAKIQRTIQTEFASSTLLCIAHRLNTVAYYDRVLVMDNGQVAEFDTVLNLFDKEDSIFRSLCEEANLQRPDILRIRAEHASFATK